jgi:hypothetical protein
VLVFITPCDKRQDIFDNLGRGRSYENSTTHYVEVASKNKRGRE